MLNKIGVFRYLKMGDSYDWYSQAQSKINYCTQIEYIQVRILKSFILLHYPLVSSLQSIQQLARSFKQGLPGESTKAQRYGFLGLHAVLATDRSLAIN